MKPGRLLPALLFGAAFLRLPGWTGSTLDFALLGLLPGLAITRWLMREDAPSARWVVGLALSPIASSVLAAGLMAAGVAMPAAAWTVAALSALACLAAPGPDLSVRAGKPERLSRPAVLWAAGLAIAILAVPVLNPYQLIRGDSWVHGGIVMELRERGFPPEDARMAGVRLNYVWCFNYFIALLTSLHDRSPFPFMSLSNAAAAFSTVGFVGLIARRLWGEGRPALAAVVLMSLGLNAGAFLFWPLRLVKALSGDVRGMAEVVRQWQIIHWNDSMILYDLSAPFARMVSFLDKLLVGTALNLAYLQMLLALWALLVWLEERRRAALVGVAAGTAGMMLVHSVVGLSVGPVLGGVLVLAALLRRVRPELPPARVLLAGVAAIATGALLTLPYLRSITAGWSPEQAGFENRFLSFNAYMPWTLLTACFFPLLLLRRTVLASWRERRPLPLILAGYAAAMAVFAMIVHLPYENDVKFVFQVFAPCVILAVPGFAGLLARTRERPALRTVALAVVFLLPSLLTLRGYVVDPTGATRAEIHPRPGEEALYSWMRRETPRDAVIVDREFRDLVAVKAARRLYLGTVHTPELAAFPAPEWRRRRRVMADLYGPFEQPDSTLAGLRALGRPVYVLYRPEDPVEEPEPWKRLIGAAPGSEAVYEDDGYRLVRVAPGGRS